VARPLLLVVCDCDAFNALSTTATRFSQVYKITINIITIVIIKEDIQVMLLNSVMGEQ